MYDPFASALDAQFIAPGSEAAEHRSIFGVITEDVRVIRSRPDTTLRLGDGPIITSTMAIEVRKSQLPVLCAGDTMLFRTFDDAGEQIAEEEVVLTGEPMSDVEALTWMIGAEPVDAAR
jgi:hypothetical protein